MPEDKIEWRPMGLARSVLDQMQEVATSARYFLPLVLDGTGPPFDEQAREEAVRLRAGLDSLEKCIQAARVSVAEYCQAVNDTPDGMLEQEVVVPFGGPVKWTMADVLAGVAWNFTYHLGQINQIQLMLGDGEMH